MSLKRDIVLLYEENPNITVLEIMQKLNKKDNVRFRNALIYAQALLRGSQKACRDTRNEKWIANSQYESW